MEIPSPARPSGIARYLEARKHKARDVTEELEASMADSIDSILRAEHRISERWRPSTTQLAQSMPSRRRAELVSWMMQSFDILHLDDAFLHSVTLTLDRYYAKQPAPLDESLLQFVLLSAVCTELKTAGADDFPENDWKRLLSHLCQGRVPLVNILQTESEMLARLDYVVGLPTPVSFLRSLGLRLRGEAVEKRWLALATFLLELALLDPQLEYDYPHFHLAAGALSAAFRVLEAPPQKRQDLLEDVEAYLPPAGSTKGWLNPRGGTGDLVLDLLECEEDLLELWIRCTMGIAEVSEFFPFLKAKFSRNARHNVSLLSPNEALARIREERLPGRGRRPEGGSSDVGQRRGS
jgi:hypothetical protein